MEFETWLKKVDDFVYNKLDLHLKDLPDEDFWVHWDNRVTYEVMANKIITNQYNFLSFMNYN